MLNSSPLSHRLAPSSDTLPPLAVTLSPSGCCGNLAAEGGGVLASAAL